VSQHSNQGGWFVQVPANPKGSPFSYSKRAHITAIFSTWKNSVTHFRVFIHPFISDTIFQTTTLLPSVTWQQHVMEYWWEGSTPTAIPPTSASDVIGQHHKIRGITFRAALVFQRISSCAPPTLRNLLPLPHVWLRALSVTHRQGTSVYEQAGSFTHCRNTFSMLERADYLINLG